MARGVGGSGTVTTQERMREQALEAYDVLASPPRRELEALVELAAKFTGVPMATINLITSTQQWQVATYGFEAAVCDREDSMCRFVVEGGEPILLPDASLDERFRDNPFTTGEIADVRFYASYPLETPAGVVLGTLCVFDTEVHPVDPETEHALATLAARVVDVLELELTSRKLAAANERLGAFAGQVSHDLKNPLSAIRMSVELAREGAAEGSDLARLLERAERGAQRMNSMISELLEFARGGAAPERVDVDLDKLLSDVLEDLSGAFTPGQVEAGPLPVVRGDSVQLRTVLQNLVANAVKFSGRGRAGPGQCRGAGQRLVDRRRRPRAGHPRAGPGACLRADGAAGPDPARLRDRAGDLPPDRARARWPDGHRRQPRRRGRRVVRAAGLSAPRSVAV